ncbi:hypothetical protein [Metabacillus idriensis]|nr:hypothetical protein [Metabacillus idriensis]
MANREVKRPCAGSSISLMIHLQNVTINQKNENEVLYDGFDSK